MARTAKLIGLLLCSLLTAAAAQTQTPQPTTPTEKTVEIVPYVSVVLPPPWVLISRTRSAIEIAYPFSEEQSRKAINPQAALAAGQSPVTANARIAIEVGALASHAEALKRLAQIISEEPESPFFLVIAGWPAVERRRTAPLPRPGGAQGAGEVGAEGNATFVTVAIAAGTYVIRFEAVVAPSADPKLADAAVSIARNIRVRPGDATAARADLKTLSQSIAQPRTTLPPVSPHGAAPSPPPAKTAPATASSAALVMQGTGPFLGELEVAVSDDGTHVIVVGNRGFSFSDDGGKTFTVGGGTPCVFQECDGDASVAIGKSGAVYYSWMGFPNNEPAAFPPPNGTTNTVSVSTDNGHSFQFASNAVLCPSSASLECSGADQPHIAADRFSLSSFGLDRVYLVWRNFSSVSQAQRIVCSNDGALTWPQQASIDAAGDFPRVTVGPDGSVFVAYVSGSNIMVRKFSACDQGFTPQPSVVVSTFASVDCPMPGLDRCNNGNVLSSPTAAVDPLDANHVYVAWATSTEKGVNEDIRVAESKDGGLTFPRSARVNRAVTARRFMPWVCASQGNALVGWYDRRSATTANIDLTAYFAGMVTSGGADLDVSADVNVSGVSDPQCGSGWPCAPRIVKDATSCSQPQLAGRCSKSGKACNFASPQCPPGETCNTGNGCPKYGDYNGAACASGQLFAAWASATSPTGLAPVSTISIFSTSVTVPAPTCSASLTLCSGDCVNTNSDPFNCGGCGNACRVSVPLCRNGKCTGCPVGTQSCCDGSCRRTCPICP